MKKLKRKKLDKKLRKLGMNITMEKKCWSYEIFSIFASILGTDTHKKKVHLNILKRIGTMKKKKEDATHDITKTFQHSHEAKE